MSGVILELEQTLNRIDPQSASLLEQLVRDAIALVGRTAHVGSNAPLDAIGWPMGHFDRYAGSLAGDDWTPPADPPAETTPSW